MRCWPLRCTRRGRLTPYAFVRAMKKGGVPAPAEGVDAQAVRLLTVLHGAKAGGRLRAAARHRHPPAKAETMAVLVDWPGEQALPRQLHLLASESRPPASAEDHLAASSNAERQRGN